MFQNDGDACVSLGPTFSSSRDECSLERALDLDAGVAVVIENAAKRKGVPPVRVVSGSYGLTATHFMDNALQPTSKTSKATAKSG